MFPAFGALVSERAPELQQEERYRAYRAVRVLLSTLARDTPVVLVLDDVQWADPGSMELISHLLAHPCQGAVLVALGFRPAQVSPQLHGALAAALRHEGAQRLDLAPLSPAAARDLLGPEVSRSVFDRIYRESGGNPFFLLQLARGEALAGPRSPAGRPTFPRSCARRLPASCHRCRRPRWSCCWARPSPAIHSRAAGGRRRRHRGRRRAGSDRRAAGVSARPPDRHPPGSSPFATRSSARRSTTSPRAAGEPTRTRGSRRCSPPGDAPAAAQAPHVERSAEHGDADAIAVLVAAATSSARRPPALAARWYTAALRLLPDATATEGQRIELLLAMANALAGAGEIEQSHQRAVRGSRAHAGRAPRHAWPIVAGLRRRRAAPRPPSRRALAADAGASLPAGHPLARGRPAADRAGSRRVLRGALRGDARMGRAGARGSGAAR